MTVPPAPRRGTNERGGAIVEFAILLPLLLVVSLGVVDLGRAYETAVQLASAAREGAGYAQTHPLAQVPSGTSCADPDNIRYHAQNENGTLRTDRTVSVTPSVGCLTQTGGAPIQPGDSIKVTVSQAFIPLTPILSLLTGPLTVSQSVTMVVQG